MRVEAFLFETAYGYATELRVTNPIFKADSPWSFSLINCMPYRLSFVSVIRQGDPVSEFLIADNVLIRYNGAGGSVIIPDGITKVGNEAFIFNRDVTEVTIPDSVTSIGDSAFRGMHITGITIPAGVINIEDYAFYGGALGEVTFTGTTPPTLGLKCFNGNIRLSEYMYPIYVPAGSKAAYEAVPALQGFNIVEVGGTDPTEPPTDETEETTPKTTDETTEEPTDGTTEPTEEKTFADPKNIAGYILGADVPNGEADFNGDGKVDVFDLAFCKQKTLK